MKWIGQHIYDLVSRFRDDVYLEDISSGTIASGGNLGLDSNNKIVKQSDTGITDLHGAGVDGSNNQVLTDDGDGTVTSESALTFSGNSLATTQTLDTSISVPNAAIQIDANYSGNAAQNSTGLWLDFDRTVAGSGTAVHDDIGINLDVTSASLGTSSLKGMDIDVVGATSGTSTAYGIDINVSGADTNYALITSGGNVGIGTTAPVSLLHVNIEADLGASVGDLQDFITLSGDDANNDSLTTSLIRSSTTNSGSQWTSSQWRMQRKIDATWSSWINFGGEEGSGSHSHGLSFGVGSSTGDALGVDEAMRIESNGNVGIGASSPNKLLHLQSSTGGMPDVLIDNVSTVQQNGGALIFQNADTNDFLVDDKIVGEIVAKAYDITDGDYLNTGRIAFRTDGLGANNDIDGRIDFEVGAGNNVLTTAMVIKSDGAVGIGDTSPVAGTGHLTIKGLTVNPLTITPTSDGSGTGTIPAGASLVKVNSSDAAHIAVLPAIVVGYTVRLISMGTGFELATELAEDSHGINGNGGSGYSSTIGTFDVIDCTCVSSNRWVCTQINGAGVQSAVEVNH